MNVSPLPIKKTLRELLEKPDFEQIAEMAATKKRVLGSLVSLCFDRDPQIGWRAVEAMGWAGSRIARSDPQSVRDHMRRLQWLLSEESGGICWRAPEAMAEIVHREPTLLADYVPIVVSLPESLAEEDLEHFKAGALWAIGRLAAVAGDSIAAILPAITTALEDPDAQVRGMAVWCLGQTGQAGLLAGRQNLLADDGPVGLYEDGVLHRTSVRRLVQQCLASLRDDRE